MVTFAHLADCHIGAWRAPKMRVLGDHALTQAISKIIEKKVDFVVIAGDLFHTALPGIDHVKHVVKEFTRLKQAAIPIYLIAGSHDYSPTGKTMLDVLEEAKLCVNVYKTQKGKLQFTTDKNTGVRLAGIPGRAGQLDKKLYEETDMSELSATANDIFLFHTGIEELRPTHMPHVAMETANLLPKNYGYYAGGHIHIVKEQNVPGYAKLAYPGPLYPVNFAELEKLGNGGFFFVTNRNGAWEATHAQVPLKKTLYVHVETDNDTPETLTQKLREKLDEELTDTIILVRLTGKLLHGTAADIDFRGLFSHCEAKGAYFCMKNTTKLQTPQLQEVHVQQATTEEIEEQVIEEHAGQLTSNMTKEEEKSLLKTLLHLLGQQQSEEETKKDYEKRIVDEAKKELNI